MDPNRRHNLYRPQIPADPLRGNPCDSRDPRRCVPPLKGLRETLTASVSYRASVPAGHAYCEVAPSHRALAPAADRQNLSPYVYCADNPVKLVDPDGEEIYVGDDYYYRNGYLYYKGTKDIYVPEQGSFEEKALNSLNKLQSTKKGSELMTPFEGETGKDVIIKNSSDNPHTPGKVQVNDYIHIRRIALCALINKVL